MNEYMSGGADNAWKHVKWVYISLVAGLVYRPLFDWWIQSSVLLRLMQISIYLTLCFHYLQLYKDGQLSVFSKNIQFTILLLGFITFGIVVRGNWDNIEIIKLPGVLFDLINYILPFLILYLPNYRYHRCILRLFYKFIWLYPVLVFIVSRQRDIVYSENSEMASYDVANFGAGMAVFAAFLLGQMSELFNKREKWCIIGIWALALLFALLNARRGAIVNSVYMALIAFFYVCSSKGTFRNIIVFGVVGIVALVFYMNLDVFTSGMFHYLGERGMENTREGVEELFFLDFSHSPITDWIFGRGVDGGYLQSYHDSDGNIVDIRTGIETGYLNDILKGGILYVVIYSILWILSILKTLNNSKEYSTLFRWILFFYIWSNYASSTIIVYSVPAIVFWYMLSYILVQEKERNL